MTLNPASSQVPVTAFFSRDTTNEKHDENLNHSSEQQQLKTLVRFNQKRVLSLLLVFFIANYGFTLTSSHADIPSNLEPQYAQAVLAFNEKDITRAREILNGLSEEHPNIVEFLELKALIAKSTQNYEEALKVYGNLIRIKKTENVPDKDIAPYHFELGMIRYERNQDALARLHLEEALLHHFNEIPSRFFLGMIEFRNSNLSRSEEHFQKVSDSDMSELKSAAHYYIAQIYLKIGSASSATHEFAKAQAMAEEQFQNPEVPEESRKIASQIYQSSLNALRPFDKSGLFGSLNLISAYDSNVLAVGSGIPGVTGGSTTASGEGTIKQTLMAHLGYSSSPLRSTQFVPSYRVNLNVNANSNTLNGEYFTHNLSLFITRHALDPISYGLKLDGTYIFQDQPAFDNARNFSPYSLVGSFGPYLRVELSPKTAITIEASVSPQKYYLDSSLTADSNQRRSGMDYTLRGSIRNDRGNRLWNPGGWVLLDYNNTEGTEFNSTSVTLELNNVMHLANRLNLHTAIDAGIASYKRDPNPGRTDLILTADINPTYRLTSSFSLLADFQYTSDQVYSSDTQAVGQYQYDRFVASLGVLYIF